MIICLCSLQLRTKHFNFQRLFSSTPLLLQSCEGRMWKQVEVVRNQSAACESSERMLGEEGLILQVCVFLPGLCCPSSAHSFLPVATHMPWPCCGLPAMCHPWLREVRRRGELCLLIVEEMLCLVCHCRPECYVCTVPVSHVLPTVRFHPSHSTAVQLSVLQSPWELGF